ncbi:MAG: ABC transporter permease subunit [Bdellovibrionales bacterium]|nr:ABC transporter permease subunit [Bdellovibrionales bacterium]
MPVIYSIFKKEFKGIVFKPSFFFILFLCSLFFGVVFFNILDQYAKISSQMPNINGINFATGMIVPHLSSLNFVMMFVCPFFAIKLFSEEYKHNTFELLLTSPITSSQIVIGKFLAASAAGFVVLAVSAIYPVAGLWVAPLPIPHLLLSYVGICLVVMLYTAVSIFASSLTSSLIVSGILSIVFILSLWFVAIFRTSADGSISTVVDVLWINSHLQAFYKGGFSILDASIFLSYISLFVFMCQQVVESFRWR